MESQSALLLNVNGSDLMVPISFPVVSSASSVRVVLASSVASASRRNRLQIRNVSIHRHAFATVIGFLIDQRNRAAEKTYGRDLTAPIILP